MIELPEPLRQAVDDQKGQPLPLFDPRTKTTYLLLRADLFEQLQYVEGEDPLEGVDVGVLIAEAMREEDANDPLLDSYQEDRPRP